jgi:hypothetical protein
MMSLLMEQLNVFFFLSCVLACRGVPLKPLTGVLVEFRICLLLDLTSHWFAGCG